MEYISGDFKTGAEIEAALRAARDIKGVLDDITAAEGSRVSAEEDRAAAEDTREAAEKSRVTEEKKRAISERNRVSAEESRQAAEDARAVFEQYDPAKTYAPGNKVAFDGNSYLCIFYSAGFAPPNERYWLLIAARGDTGATGTQGPKGDTGAPGKDGKDGAGVRTCRVVVGTSAAGWTAQDCDFLCDGTADEEEINAAIASIAATGGEVLLLEGTYTTAGIISLTVNAGCAISLRGVGRDLVTIAGAAVIVSKPHGMNDAVAVRDFTMIRTLEASGGSCILVQPDHTDNNARPSVTACNISIDYSRSAAVYRITGINIRDSTATVTGCTVVGNGNGDGIVSIRKGGDAPCLSTIRDCTVSAVSTGIAVGENTSFSITGCRVSEASNVGIDVVLGKNCMITNNIVTGVTAGETMFLFGLEDSIIAYNAVPGKQIIEAGLFQCLVVGNLFDGTDPGGGVVV